MTRVGSRPRTSQTFGFLLPTRVRRVLKTIFELVGVHETGAGNTQVNGRYIQRDYREVRPTGWTKFTKYKCVYVDGIRYRNSKNLNHKNTSIEGPNCGDIVTAIFQDKGWFQTEDQPDLWLPITHPGAKGANKTIFELVGVHVMGAGNTRVNGWYIQRDYREARPTGWTNHDWDEANGYQSWYEQKIYRRGLRKQRKRTRTAETNHQPEDEDADCGNKRRGCYIYRDARSNVWNIHTPFTLKPFSSQRILGLGQNVYNQANEPCKVVLVNNEPGFDGYDLSKRTTYFIMPVRPLTGTAIEAEVGELRSRNNQNTYQSDGKSYSKVPPRYEWVDHPFPARFTENGLIQSGQAPTVTPGPPNAP